MSKKNLLIPLGVAVAGCTPANTDLPNIVFILADDLGIRTIFNFTLPVYLSLIVTVCWTIGIVNAFNLIDGLDGLAAGLASISSVCIAACRPICTASIPSRRSR